MNSSANHFPTKWSKKEEEIESPTDYTILIIVVVLVVLVLLIIVILILYWFCYRGKQRNRKISDTDVVDGFTRKPATRVSLIGHQYQPSIQIENSSSQNFLSTTEILDKDFEAKANRTSFYLFQDEMGSTNSNGSRRSSHIFTMNDVESQMITSASLLAPIASSETLESSAAISRPLSAFIEKNDVKPMAIVKPRPQSEVIEEELEKPSLPPKKASMRRAQYKSAGVLPPVSGVARKIAISKIKKKGSNRRPSNQANKEVNSQSDTDLCRHLSRKRNPFADLVGSDDDSEDDFVDFDDLPPLPEKSLPKPNIEDFPKQRINKTRSQAQRIDKALLEKYRKSPQKSTPFDEQDYEDVRMQEDTCFDYDEPIPHSKVVSELL